ncbi:MAG: hypothetical protein KatS3mg110_3663 [Pirellulaceae bacterium]|nr:MAG: hypothetical protein KatS3mg110_3663 [Pirellulaceae bacterium]
MLGPIALRGWLRIALIGLLLAGPVVHGCRPSGNEASRDAPPTSDLVSHQELPEPEPAAERAGEGEERQAGSSNNTGAGQTRPSPESPRKSAGAIARNEAGESTPEHDPGDAWRRAPRLRWIFLTDRGPILLDWLIEVDDRPYYEARRELDQAALQLVPIDRQVSWAELASESIFRLFDTPQSPDGSMSASLTRPYDENQDGQVQAAELVRFLETHPRWGRVFQMPRNLPADSPNTADDSFWQWVDYDGSGRLEQVEWKRIGIDWLDQHDRDGDGLLSARDFTDPVATSPLSDTMQAINMTETDVVMLDGRFDWTRLLYRIEERYGFGRPVQSGMWEEQVLFDELDANRNGMLDEEEVSGLEKIDPHLVMHVSWAAPDQPPAGAAGFGGTSRLAIEATPRSVRPKLDQVGPSRWLLTANALSLVIQVSDTLPLGQANDNLFSQLDRDMNNYLDRGELASFMAFDGVPFSWWDRDANGQVDPDEFSDLLAKLETVLRLRLEAGLVKRDDRLFTLLDLNQDGRLSARELLAAEKLLADADRNKDGVVEVDELPAGWRVVLVRGTGGPPRPIMTDAVANRGGPAWFAAMDTNGDGDVSVNEFLGPQELFDTLDLDGDRLLSVEEAVRAESQFPATASQQR